MQELLNNIEGISSYNLVEPKKSLFMGMVINSLIILREVDYKLINSLENTINNIKEINNINKDSIYCELMNMIIDYVYDINKETNEKNVGKKIIDNYFTNGYIFHAFNAGLYEEISTKGLLVKDRLIDTEEFRKVAEIFKKRNVQIFGLYDTKGDNSIFFSGGLHNIYQYGVGSPSFFRKFIYQNDKEDSYLKRDYDKCLDSVLKTISKYSLDSEEKKLVLEFFNKYYQIFSNNEYYVAMYSTKRIVDTDYTKDDIKRVFKEELYHNYRIHKNVESNKLIFISSNMLDKNKRRGR